jgi:hypothetical protein
VVRAAARRSAGHDPERDGARLAAIRERGIEVGKIQSIDESTRKVEIADPEGNRIGFGQAG